MKNPRVSEKMKEIWADPVQRKWRLEVLAKAREKQRGLPSSFKGKKHSEETKKKMSEKKKLMYLNHPEKLKELASYQLGKKQSLESRTKKSESAKKYWANPENHAKRTLILQEINSRPEVRQKHSISSTGRVKSQETINKLRESTKKNWQKPEFRNKIVSALNTPEIKALRSKNSSGSNNPSWLGGISKEPYSWTFNRKFKKQIRERDNFTCQECGKTEDELKYSLTVHHIDYNKKNTTPENTISLCIGCHTKTNFNREYWQKRFK
jgi:hypothetical protein